MSPVTGLDMSSTIPPEILAHIFYATATLGHTTSSAETISQVCSRWRQVALQTPFIWCYLKITANTHLEKVTSYLLRSKTSPLDLSFEFALASDPCDYIDILNTLLPHSPRWRLVSFTSEHPSLLFILPELSQASRLEEVSVTLHAIFRFPGTLVGPLNQWLARLPSPNRLKKINLDLSHPQEVTSPHTIKSLISASPSLENLSLHGCGITIPGNIPQPLINATSLRSLSLRCTPSRPRYYSQTSWLHCLDAPNLRSLELKDITRSEWPLYSDGIETRPHTYARLEKLRLVDVELAEATYSFAQALPKLEELEIVESTRTTITSQHILKMIIEDAVVALSHSQLPLWPHLRSVGISRPDTKLMDWASTLRSTLDKPILVKAIGGP